MFPVFPCFDFYYYHCCLFFLFVILVSYMIFVTRLASVRHIPLRLQFRSSVQELAGFILTLVCDLSLPRMNLPCPMFWVWLEWRYLIAIMSYHAFLALVTRFFLTVGLRMAVTPLLVVFLGLPRFFPVTVTTVGTE